MTIIRVARPFLVVEHGGCAQGANVAGAALPLAGVTGATVVLTLAATTVLIRIGRIDRATATLGMVAGGSAAVVSAAKDLDADPRMAPTFAASSAVRCPDDSAEGGPWPSGGLPRSARPEKALVPSAVLDADARHQEGIRTEQQ
ncbi:AbrB family transcriptional regulator [Actinomadura alba]|uniref:AbrB family transcriptional regulator n=1 Tax=Actinomadura alba TaxID=406431 RepID=A0ABR7LUI0_9ACTN|nr:AbrB family transcriptional regulator [Actinomadura alba]